MFVVALLKLAGTLDALAPALAADLGCAPYDARLLLGSGPPVVVRTTPERAQALELLARLRARGHDAVACDMTSVVASAAMIPARRPRLEPEAVTLDDRPGERLPYADVLCLVAAQHRSRTDTETRTTEKKLSVSRAIMTSGLSLSKTVSKSERAAAEERELVLYVFRRDGALPWLLRERGTRWDGLGVPVAPTESENFRAAIGLLRARAPAARFDDRLVSRRAPERAALAVGAGTTMVRTSSEGAMDLLAHLVGLELSRPAPV